MRAVLLLTSFGVAIGLGAAAGGPADEPKKPADPPKAETKPAAVAEAKPTTIGRPKMRSYLDFDLPPLSVAWAAGGKEPGVFLTFGRATVPPRLAAIGFDAAGQPVLSERTLDIGEGEYLVDTTSTPTEMLALTVQRDFQRVNSIYQLTARRFSDGQKNTIPVEPATKFVFRILPGMTGVLVAVDVPIGTDAPKAVVQRLDLRTGDPVGAELSIPGGLTAVAFSPDGTRVCGVTAKDQTARCWSFPEGKELWSHPMPKQADRFTAAFSADGRTVAVAASVRLTPSGGPPVPKEVNLLERLDADLGTGLTVFRAADGQVVRTVRTPTAEKVEELAVGHDGRLLVAKLIVVEVSRDSGRKLQMKDGTVREIPPAVTNVQESRKMRVYDSATGNVLQTWPDWGIVAFAPDRNVLAIAASVTRWLPFDGTNQKSTEVGRIGFWHFDTAAKK